LAAPQEAKMSKAVAKQIVLASRRNTLPTGEKAGNFVDSAVFCKNRLENNSEFSSLQVSSLRNRTGN
jgi:hypothetical protein